MSGDAVVYWDEGRLAVNRRFSRLLEDSGLRTVSDFMEFDGGEVVQHSVLTFRRPCASNR